MKRIQIIALIVILQNTCFWLGAPSFASSRIGGHDLTSKPQFDNRPGHLNWRKERLERYRSDPEFKRELAKELAMSVNSGNFFGSDEQRIIEIKELISLYPQLPLDSQQLIASWYLRFALEQMQGRTGYVRGVKLPDAEPTALQSALFEFVRCVLNVHESNHFAPDASLEEQLNFIETNSAASPCFTDGIKQQAALIRKIPESENTIMLRALSVEFENQVTTSFDGGVTHEVPVNYKPYLVKWLPMTTDEEGRPCAKLPSGELGARWVTKIKVWDIPPNASAELLSLINEISKRYSNASDYDKQMCAPALFRASSKLLQSNLREPSEKLYWQIFESVNTHWLNENQIQAFIGYGGCFFSQTYDLPKAQKVYLKQIEIANNFGGGPTAVNLSMVIGDLYDQLGDVNKSKQAYRNAKTACDNMLRWKLMQREDLKHNLNLIELRLKSDL